MNDIAQYDKKQAAEELQRQTQLRMETSYVIKCAVKASEDDGWTTRYQTVRYGPVWRLVTAPEEGAFEEVVLAFQGIIYDKDLAPFNPKCFNGRTNTARFVQQSLTLCGLKTPLFEKAANSVLEIHTLLARSVPQDDMESCSMVSSNDDGDILLHMGNRYLMPKKDAVGFTTMPIPSDIDPRNNFVYTDDNHVRYYERQKVPGSEDIRFEECNLVIFQAGDLVEAQVTFIIVNLREGKKKTSMVLRSLSLLDGTITQKSMLAQLLQRDETPKIEHPLKRHIGYDEEETASKGQADGEAEDDTRLMIRRKVGYVSEGISEATKRLSVLEIEDNRSKEGALD